MTLPLLAPPDPAVDPIRDFYIGAAPGPDGLLAVQPGEIVKDFHPSDGSTPGVQGVYLDFEHRNEAQAKSLDTSLTGASTFGLNTLTLVTSYSLYGSGCGVVTYGNDLRLLAVTIDPAGAFPADTLPTVPYFVYCSVAVFIPYVWDGGVISIGHEGQIVTPTIMYSRDADMTVRERWQRIYFVAHNDGTADAFNMFVRTSTAPSFGRQIWFDGLIATTPKRVSMWRPPPKDSRSVGGYVNASPAPPSDDLNILTNAINQPSFEDGTTSQWTPFAGVPASTFASQTGWSQNGTRSLRYTTTFAPGGINLYLAQPGLVAVPGDRVQFGATVNVLAIPANSRAGLIANFYTGGFGLISSTYVCSWTTTGIASKTAYLDVPATAVYCYVFVSMDSTPGGLVDTYWDSIFCTPSKSPCGFFDGTTPGAWWNGVRYVSTSSKKVPEPPLMLPASWTLPMVSGVSEFTTPPSNGLVSVVRGHSR